ncbi:hypothetical protein [Micromonospora sp. NPDC003241]
MAHPIVVIVFVYTPISLIAGAVIYVVTATALHVVAPDLLTSPRGGVSTAAVLIVCGLVGWYLPEIMMIIARLANAALRLPPDPAHLDPTAPARSCPTRHSAADSADASAGGHGTNAGTKSDREE